MYFIRYDEFGVKVNSQFLRGGTVGAVEKRSPPASVTRVRLPYSPFHVGLLVL